MVFPKEGKSFDPVLIPSAIKNAGFSVPAVQVTVAGTIERSGSNLLLKVPGLKYSFTLKGGKQYESLKQQSLVGKTVTISGSLVNPSPRPKPPFELSVDSFERGAKPPPRSAN